MSARGSNLPGRGPALTYTMMGLGVLVLLPLAALIGMAASLSPERFVEAITSPRARAAFSLSLYSSIAAAAINTVFGSIVAWVLARFQFQGRGLLDALIDLPFALPTAVAGIALTAVYAENGWLGGPLAALGVKVAFTPIGVTLALVFVGFPFVVRTMQPVIADLERDVEEAAATLGATPFQIGLRVLAPAIAPAALTGFTLAFARGLGEYGSVVFISGNLPLKTEIAPLLIMGELEQFDYASAAAIGVALLFLSLSLLVVLDRLATGRDRLESS